jgi:hypothetical protein
LFWGYPLLDRETQPLSLFQEAIEALANNDKAISALGPPITVGKVDLSIANRKNKKNYAGETDSHVSFENARNPFLNGHYNRRLLTVSNPSLRQPRRRLLGRVR